MTDIAHAQKWISDENPSAEEIESCLHRIFRADVSRSVVDFLIDYLAAVSGANRDDISAALEANANHEKQTIAPLLFDPSSLGGTHEELDERVIDPVSLESIPGILRGCDIARRAAKISTVRNRESA